MPKMESLSNRVMPRGYMEMAGSARKRDEKPEVILQRKRPISCSSGSEDKSSEELLWIKWFCGLRGNEFFCEVDPDYILDEFNLEGLSVQFGPYYRKCLEIILNFKSDKVAEHPCLNKILGEMTKALYGLIHSRYILTAEGIAKMLVKYENGDFGNCRRVYCENQPMLPIGLYDKFEKTSVKLYCPKCLEVYNAPSLYKHIDGAYFGTSFPHQFFMSRPELRPERPTYKFVPRLYGFKIHPLAYQVQK